MKYFIRTRNFALLLCLLLAAQAAQATDPVVKPAPLAGSSCAGGCSGSITAGLLERQLIKLEAESERRFITQLFSNFESWIVGDFFNNNVRPALQDMASELTASGVEQTAIFGSFLDAKQQLEVQNSLQSLLADAHRDYQTSAEMCAIGTAAIGMGAADRNGEAVAQGLARASEFRQLGSFNTEAGDGPAEDRASRLATYKSRFCDPGDNGGGLAVLCSNTPPEGQNRDVSYTQTIETPQSLNMNFDGQSFNDKDMSNGQPASPTSAPDDQDVVALADNLFGHDLFSRQSTAVLADGTASAAYLDARSVIAKRSVAENSFFAIAGMKSAGSETSEAEAPYIQAIFQQLGVSADEAADLVGVRPSYYSLLDAMSRRLYQSPQFFSNLYDTPANVERKDVAMQAIGLMLDRDQYKSELRSEADLAVLLELELQPRAQRVQDRLKWLTQK